MITIKFIYISEIRPGIKPKLLHDTTSYPFHLFRGWLFLGELWVCAGSPLGPLRSGKASSWLKGKAPPLSIFGVIADFTSEPTSLMTFGLLVVPRWPTN